MAGKKYHLQVVIGATSKVGGALKKVGSELKSAISSFGVGITRLRDALDLGQYAVSAGKFLAGLATDAADAGSKVNDLAQRTGIAMGTIQELGYAADLAGASAEDFGSALDTMTKNVGQLIAGKGKLKGFLAEVADAKFVKALKTAKPDERLELLFGAMLQIKDEAKRAAFATAVFGDAGAKLAPLANEGADGLARMRKEARELGLVMSDEDVKAMDDFGDETAKLEKSWTGVKREFGMALAKEFLPLIKDALTWLKANRSEVGKFAKVFAGGVLDAAKAVMGAFKWIYDHREDILSWAKTLAIVIGGIKVAGLIGDLGKLGGLIPGVGGGGGAGIGGLLGGGLMGGLSVAGIGAIGVGVGAFIDSYFPGQEERDRRRKDFRGEKLAHERSLTGGALENIMVPTTPKDGAKPSAAWLVGGGGVEDHPTAAQMLQAQGYSAAHPAAFGGSPFEIKLIVQDPNNILGVPRVDAPAGTKVTTKKLDRGTRGASKP